MRLVRLGVFAEHQAAEVDQTVDELEQLADAIGDGLAEGVQPLQVLLVHLTDAFHAFVHGPVVCIGAALWPLRWLHQQPDGSHCRKSRGAGHLKPKLRMRSLGGNASNSKSRESWWSS